MKVTLLFPPATDPRAPHLAMPSLAASLRQAGIEVDQIDIDVEGLHALLRNDTLGSAVRRLASGAGTHIESARRTSLLRLGEGLAERAHEALRIIQDPKRFFNANDFNAARATLDAAVAVASGAALMPLEYSLDPIRYDVRGCDARSLGDLLRVTALDESNLFHEFWEEEVLPRVDASHPAVAGISLANRQQLLPGLTLARRLKARGHFVVLGGTLISKFADSLTSWPKFFEVFADGVVVFEGETALLELLGQLEGTRDFSKVPNFRYLEGGRVRATTAHVEDVNALPAPDFTGLPLHRYLVPKPVLPILFGKGCYHSRCSFCDIPHINRMSPMRYRPRDPDRIVADLRGHEQRFGARHFVVTDESIPPEVLCRLADALVGDCARYSFTGYARLESGFTRDVCRRIAGMGFRKLFFGLESAAQRTLDHMCKGTSAAAAPAVLRACRESRIHFHLFCMIGLPEENEASARETLRFLIDNQDVIDQAGNSFDIHRFGLDVRARYFADRDRLGICVDTGALQHEFLVSLSHRDWENTKGLSRQRVDELLAEFQSELRRTYTRFHNAPRNPWPPFEEHAVLYGDHYQTRQFPYGTDLPAETNGRRFRLRISPACARLEFDRGTTLISYWLTTDLPAPLVRVFEDQQARTVGELVSDCVLVQPGQAARSENLVRNLVMELLGKGVIQLEWTDTEGRREDDTQARAGAPA